MDSVAWRTRGRRWEKLMAEHHEWKEKERKEKERKDSVAILVESSNAILVESRKGNRSDENGFKAVDDVLMIDDLKSAVSKRDISDGNQRSGKGIDCSSESLRSEDSDSVVEVTGKATRSVGSNNHDIEWIQERPNPCPSKRTRSNWKRLQSKRARIDEDGMEIIEGDQINKSSGSHGDGGDGKEISSASSGSTYSSSEEDPDDADYMDVSSSSDADSGSCNAAKVKKREKDDFVGTLYVGSDEAFSEGKASIMMLDEYDALEVEAFIPMDKKEKKDTKKRFGSRWSKRVQSQSDSQTKVPVDENSGSDSSDENGGGSYSDPMENKGEKPGKKKAEKKSSKKKASVASIKNAINSLITSALLEEAGASDDLGAPEVPMQTELPLKFNFDDEKPAPPEKEPWEREMDDLFSEIDMCLTAIYSAEDNASSSSSKAEETEETLRAKSPIERCRLGFHEEVLEEPIGKICKVCSLVLLEMKYIFPNLIMRSPKKRDSFYMERDELYEYDDIRTGDSVTEDYITSIQTEGSVLDLIPSKTRRSMYRHQLDGFVFLWKNVVGETSIEKLKEFHSKQGSGCIISHAPGTGKTFLTIVFIRTLMESFPYSKCRPVVVAPKSMLLTWQHEFEKWDFGFPFHNLNSDELSVKDIEVLGLEKLVSRQNGRKVGTHFIRKLKLCSWTSQRSILGVSYSLFEKTVNGPEKQFLLEKSGLLVLDEGHTPRNKNSCMWKALKEVKTRKRIILSGTPFQNSFQELQTTLYLVNPDLSSNSDLNWKNLKAGAIDKDKDRDIAKLKAMIDPLVHVHKGTILQERLPGLKDMLVILRPTPEQKLAFEAISDAGNQFEKVHLVSLVSVHPSLAGKKEFLKPKPGLEFLDDTRPDAGVKTRLVIELVKLCDALKEKVLIFSEFIDPLNFLKQQFNKELSWIEGREVLYMDGKQEAKMRQSSISSLNDRDSEVKVLLASTRACSEGIHLVGASRVVLLDVVWNPSVERQAISRAFRLGQTKVVYVYHLITKGTLEVAKYEMQTRKHRLSELVFSSRDMESKKKNILAAVAEDKVLEQMMDDSDRRLKGIFEEIVHNPKEGNLFDNFSFC